MKEDVKVSSLERDFKFYHEYKNSLKINRRKGNAESRKKREEKVLKRIMWEEEEQRNIHEEEDNVDSDLNIDEIA